MAAIKRVKLSVNPQVSEMIQQFDDDIADDQEFEDGDDEHELEIDNDETENEIEETKHDIPKLESLSEPKKKRPPPPLIALKDLNEEDKKDESSKKDLKRKSNDGPYGPLLSGRANTRPGTMGLLKRCRVDVDRMGLDHIAEEPVSVSGRDLLEIARNKCDKGLFEKMKLSLDRSDSFCDAVMEFSDGQLRVHKLVLAAASPLLHEMLAEGETDTLIFPDISLVEGKMAVEALYTGNVKINRRSLVSLSSVERCVRTFQQIGLLENYSIQISSLLPLENFNSTRTHTVRPASPPSPPAHAMMTSPPVSPSPQVSRVNSPADNNAMNKDNENNHEDDEEKRINVNDELGTGTTATEVTKDTLNDMENNVSAPEATLKAQSPKRKSLSPNKQETVRKDCNKPKFSEVSLDEIKDMGSSSPGELISWLQDTGFLCSAPPRCRGCGKLTHLQESPDIDGLAWKCPSREKCVPGSVSPSLLREHSIFQFSKDKLLWILKIIICWRENTSLSQCHEVTNILVTKFNVQ